ncbi:hypothetical protein BT63DRAFT_429349 [Microthyrium microscopicum]|uniref:Uncharacterized protein n=1 Tax=Microthyrium microscopicum TaxID=703497 RepID=A0A6A6U0E6_9PEZI|nr:hypothetical protein BT63DRAFT_429349 [Microthyrium microscopicum]
MSSSSTDDSIDIRDIVPTETLRARSRHLEAENEKWQAQINRNNVELIPIRSEVYQREKFIEEQRWAPATPKKTILRTQQPENAWLLQLPDELLYIIVGFAAEPEPLKQPRYSKNKSRDLRCCPTTQMDVKAMMNTCQKLRCVAWFFLELNITIAHDSSRNEIPIAGTSPAVDHSHSHGRATEDPVLDDPPIEFVSYRILNLKLQGAISDLKEVNKFLVLLPFLQDVTCLRLMSCPDFTHTRWGFSHQWIVEQALQWMPRLKHLTISDYYFQRGFDYQQLFDEFLKPNMLTKFTIEESEACFSHKDNDQKYAIGRLLASQRQSLQSLYCGWIYSGQESLTAPNPWQILFGNGMYFPNLRSIYLTYEFIWGKGYDYSHISGQDLVHHLIGPSMVSLTLDMDEDGNSGEATSVEHFDEWRAEWFPDLAKAAAQTNLQKVDIIYSPQKPEWVSRGQSDWPEEKFVYPWDVIDRLVRDYKAKGLSLSYNPPSVSREEWSAVYETAEVFQHYEDERQNKEERKRLRVLLSDIHRT